MLIERADTFLDAGKRSTGLLILAALSSAGTTFGDLATSPLYTLNAIFPASQDVPQPDYVLGAISAILWSLILVGILKTAIIALHFRNQAGEGGPVALYASLFPPKDPKIPHTWLRPIVTFIALFAASLTIADGILAPSVSVLAAVKGMAVNVDGLNTPEIKGIAVAFLFILFSVQFLGIARLSHYFMPVICIWLLLLMALGIYNITLYPGIFRAFDPSRAILWFVHTGRISPLSGVLLCITGVESLYASMSQYDPLAIRIGFILFAFPALALNYLGQGAFLMAYPTPAANVFFLSLPNTKGNVLFWIVWIVAVAAAVVASQGVIMATFSLIQHLVGLKSFPPIKIVHTSSERRAVIYIPLITFLLMVGSLCVTGAYGKDLRTDETLTNAYGFCVSGTLFCTTILLSLVMRYVSGWHWAIVLSFLVLSGFIDGLFFSASLEKVPHGAWLTLCVSVTLAAFLCFWTWAKRLEDGFDSSHRFLLNRVLHRYVDIDAAYEPHSFSALAEKTSIDQDENSSEKVRFRSSSPHARSNTPNGHSTPNGNGLLTPPLIVDEHDKTLRTFETKEEDDDGSLERGMLHVHQPNLAGILTRQPSPQTPDGRRVRLLVDDNPSRGMTLEDGNGEPMKLPRVPSFAFFYHFGTGVGAPHSFTSLARRTLALPRVVIFLSLQTQAVPFVEDAEQISMTKLKGLDGFYVLILRLGYRDRVDLRNIQKPAIQRIIQLERQGETTLNQGEFFHQRLQSIEEASRVCTHIIPSYAPFRSKKVKLKNRLLETMVNSWRAYLLETVFTGATQIFPETSSWIIDEQRILRVGVSAEI